MNNLKKAVEFLGGQTELAKALGVSQPRIWNWINRDKKVPAEYAMPIQTATNGKVTARDLRPDIFGEQTTS
ncbi:MAG: Cro/Cl family transcriptional regulator [Gammaproteobacteria bacterium]|nr:Cro/Cl family transcriptional regulator [Gammaproteobacteria bacterium]